MLNHSDSVLAVAVALLLSIVMFIVGWLTRSLAVSELPICERTIVIKDGSNVEHEYIVECK